MKQRSKPRTKGQTVLFIMFIIFAFPAAGFYYFVKYRTAAYEYKTKKQALDNDLTNNIISQKEYDKKISDLDLGFNK